MSRFKFLIGLVIVGLAALNLPAPVLSPLKEVFWTAAEPFVFLVHRTARGMTEAMDLGQAATPLSRHAARRSGKRRSGQASGVASPKIADPFSTTEAAFHLEELKIENERLRRLLDLKERLPERFPRVIAAEVIGRSPGGWRDTLIVNKGSRDGLKPDMPVMAGGGLLGKVVESTALTSKVKLLTHPRIRVGAMVQRTRYTGVIYGSSDGECRMKYLAMDADVRKGDLVETAPFSDAFPKGIYIGEITDVWKAPGQLYKIASVKLAADTDRLEEVLCVEPP